MWNDEFTVKVKNEELKNCLMTVWHALEGDVAESLFEKSFGSNRISFSS